MVYAPSSVFGPWEPSVNFLVAGNEQEFQTLVTAHEDDADFAGTLIFTDDAAVGVWPPTTKGAFHFRLRLRDLAYYNDVWAPNIAAGWTPGFVNELVADPTPSVADSVMVIDTWEALSADVAKVSRIRIAKADGAAGVVFTHLVVSEPLLAPQTIAANGGIPIPALGGGNCGGPFHRLGVCCITQAIFCQITTTLGGCQLQNGATCVTCVADCFACNGSNPCHSCDPCGLTHFLACVLRVFGNC
ncbi:MAG: hypothetical protein D6744_11030 [Planctomycetota bacterium]|nr:MAG: hypothetical protein D6744_11030 [Planctomycetota bacterium]